MRFLPYFILAYLTLGVQLGLGDFVSWHGARPNLVLVAVLFVALNAPRDAALLGCFALGLLQDLLSQQALGLYALSYGLVAILVSGIHQHVGKENAVIHAVLALVGGLMTAIVLSIHALIRPAAAAIGDGPDTVPIIRIEILPFFTTALYTTLLALPLLWLLNRFKRAFAFQGYYRRGYR